MYKMEQSSVRQQYAEEVTTISNESTHKGSTENETDVLYKEQLAKRKRRSKTSPSVH